MADQIKQTNVQRPYKTMHTDNHPVDQPQDTYRFMLNGVDETQVGDGVFSSNEGAHIECAQIPVGFVVIGDRYLEDNTSALWLVNPLTGRSQIGLLHKDCTYEPIVDTGCLGFKITHQIDATYRLRRGNERVVYWVNALGRPGTFNFDRKENFYTKAYRDYLSMGGNPGTFLGERWDCSSFDLLKSYSSIPFFSNVEILDYGTLYPGSYNFAIQYLDNDLNPTEWITTSNTVNVFNDGLDKPYFRIRGSRNTQNDSQNFPRTNKSIKLTITNLDTNFPFYRIGVIEAIGNTGEPTRALVSESISTSNSVFVYSGNDAALTETNIVDILVQKEVINAPKHIEQLENRLILANGEGSPYNWCSFQKYASKIETNIVKREVVLNDVSSEPNQKNAKSTFLARGLMPGDIYSLGIVYIMKDGSLSPTFHIPGKHISNTTSREAYHEADYSYLDIHNCLDGNDYWGVDSKGNPLVGRSVRHHKVPTRRRDFEKLITSTNSTVQVTKYRLKFKVELAPGKTYPVDLAGNPILIDYTALFRPSYAPTPLNYNSYISQDDLGQDIIVYDDIYVPQIVSGANLIEIDPNSELILNYQPPGNETFVITFSNDSYLDRTISNATTARIYGFEFSAVEKPHPDVVGFYIVRQEKFDEDRVVSDNALLGINKKSQQYRAFGLWAPKVQDSAKDTESTWFWSPEHQFFKKRLDFSKVEVQGYYAQSFKHLSSYYYSHTFGGGDTRYFRALLVNDVYPGTSYNKDVHKKNDKDDDGFSLAVGWRNLMLDYYPVLDATGSYPMPTVDKIIQLDACAYKPEGQVTYYNTSCDNKIGIIKYNNIIDFEFWKDPDPYKTRLLYASLMKERVITTTGPDYNHANRIGPNTYDVGNGTAYSDFLTRPFYKEHNNPYLFGNSTIIDGVEVYNGDSFISPANLITSMFWEQRMAQREKKDRTWQIIAGAVLIVAGIVVGIFTGGAGLSISAVGVGVLAGLAIAYGVSLAMSGIKFEQMKNMIDNDYVKGLKETIEDQDNKYLLDGIYNYPGPQSPYPDDGMDKVNDDAFIWFSDRLTNTWIESSMPYAIRVGLTSSTPDFVDSPNPQFDKSEFENYLIEKFTVLDSDRGSGRLYKGYPSAEVYDINLDFMRFNKEKTFIHLPAEYDCCTVDGHNERFPTRVWYSQQSFQEERTDNYGSFLPNNYRDIEGEHGEITDLYRMGNSLFVHSKEALWQLPQNIQERVTGEIISFIGTGDFFSIPPRKVLDDTLGSGGTQHKWSTVKTKYGVFFISEIENKIYLHTGDALKILDNGLRNEFENKLRSFLSQQIYDITGTKFPQDNNPANPHGVGYLASYDTRHERVLFTKRDYKILPQYIEDFTLIDLSTVTSLNPTLVDIPIGALIFETSSSRFVIITDKTVITGTGGQFIGFIYQYSPVTTDMADYFEDHSWTISYTIRGEGWKSWHSYLPTYYIHNQDNLYLTKAGSNIVWKANTKGQYQRYFGQLYPHIIEYVSLSNPITDKIWDDITIQTTAKKYNQPTNDFIDQRFITFNKIILWNSRQTSGEQDLIVKETEGNGERFLYNQIRNNRPNEILITRKDRNWNFNHLRDYRTDYDVPIFSTKWDDIKDQYPIDKVLTPGNTDFDKDWTQIEIFKDKYLVIRLIFDNFDDINLITHYVLDTEQQSFR